MVAFSGRIDCRLRHEQTFSSLDNYQTQLLPAAVVDDVLADHLAQFVVVLAREHLDLSEIVASCKAVLVSLAFRPRR